MRPGAEPTWSWVRVPAMGITSGEATLTLHEDDGTKHELPARVSRRADADVVLEADPPSGLSIDTLDLRMPDGRRHRTAGAQIVVAR